MSIMIIMRGPSGSGKTTRARELQKEYNALINSADKYFMVKGEYCFNADQLPAAHNWCQDRTRCACEDGQNVIVDNTNMSLWEMKPYVEMAEEFGYEVKFQWGKNPMFTEALRAVLEMGDKCFAMFNTNKHGTPPEVIFAQLAKLGPCPVFSPDLRDILVSKSPMELAAEKEQV
jgi:predicted kinase